MKLKKLKLKTEIEIHVPAGTKVIASNDWITLARKSRGIYYILTCPSEDINSENPEEEKSYVAFRKRELQAILKM